MTTALNRMMNGRFCGRWPMNDDIICSELVELLLFHIWARHIPFTHTQNFKPLMCNYSMIKYRKLKATTKSTTNFVSVIQFCGWSNRAFYGWFSHSLSNILLNFQPLDKQTLGFDVYRRCFLLSPVLLCDENEESTVTGNISCEQLDECPSFWIHLPQSRALFELNRVDNPFYGSSIFFFLTFRCSNTF